MKPYYRLQYIFISIATFNCVSSTVYELKLQYQDLKPIGPNAITLTQNHKTIGRIQLDAGAMQSLTTGNRDRIHMTLACGFKDYSFPELRKLFPNINVRRNILSNLLPDPAVLAAYYLLPGPTLEGQSLIMKYIDSFVFRSDKYGHMNYGNARWISGFNHKLELVTFPPLFQPTLFQPNKIGCYGLESVKDWLAKAARVNDEGMQSIFRGAWANTVENLTQDLKFAAQVEQEYKMNLTESVNYLNTLIDIVPKYYRVSKHSGIVYSIDGIYEGSVLRRLFFTTHEVDWYSDSNLEMSHVSLLTLPAWYCLTKYNVWYTEEIPWKGETISELIYRLSMEEFENIRHDDECALYCAAVQSILRFEIQKLMSSKIRQDEDAPGNYVDLLNNHINEQVKAFALSFQVKELNFIKDMLGPSLRKCTLPDTAIGYIKSAMLAMVTEDDFDAPHAGISQ